jgi:hypothetical protein
MEKPGDFPVFILKFAKRVLSKVYSFQGIYLPCASRPNRHNRFSPGKIGWFSRFFGFILFVSLHNGKIVERLFAHRRCQLFYSNLPGYTADIGLMKDFLFVNQ